MFTKIKKWEFIITNITKKNKENIMASNSLSPKISKKEFDLPKRLRKKVEKRKADIRRTKSLSDLSESYMSQKTTLLKLQKLKDDKKMKKSTTPEKIKAAIAFCTMNTRILENMDQPIGNLEQKAMKDINQSDQTMSEMNLMIKELNLELVHLRTLLLNADLYRKKTKTTFRKSNARRVLELLDTDMKGSYIQMDKLKKAMNDGTVSASRKKDGIAKLKVAIYERIGTILK